MEDYTGSNMKHRVNYLNLLWPNWLPPLVRESFPSGNVPDEIITHLYEIANTLQIRNDIGTFKLDSLWAPNGILTQELKRENGIVEFTIASAVTAKQRILYLLQQGGVQAVMDGEDPRLKPVPIRPKGQEQSGAHEMFERHQTSYGAPFTQGGESYQLMPEAYINFNNHSTNNAPHQFTHVNFAPVHPAVNYHEKGLPQSTLQGMAIEGVHNPAPQDISIGIEQRPSAYTAEELAVRLATAKSHLRQSKILKQEAQVVLARLQGQAELQQAMRQKLTSAEHDRKFVSNDHQLRITDSLPSIGAMDLKNRLDLLEENESWQGRKRDLSAVKLGVD
ncbi:hypothetical protein FLAG1_06715 [Fusarium langsethiae]|uniref:Uncharacterized protein n=1 Tax=Fusarium langsethiae TaxID=179993 RepID=A0A0M9EVM7_FUSLA|nr:hypothetical protein FLAG1_06715 [Fusarium langsethiae]GKU05780.1 unnamed protein product [Fusarium langsethiae]GKU20844.1 unnamed protein product [Fusarium langsethiae]